MAGRALLLRAEPGFSLPAFERFAPPPPPALIAARIDAASQPGDIVLDLFGRGGWIARAAIDGQRKGISLEGTALDRLLAEIVLRPPDLRHLDAAVQALAASARRESSLKTSITDRFASRCATCERPVTLDEITWSTESEGEDGRPIGPQPTRKHYRCPVCRDQLGGGEQRQAPLDANDLRLALDRDDDGARAFLRDRFPVLEGGESLADELLDLHTPRQLSALAAILERVEGDLRAASIAAALRLVDPPRARAREPPRDVAGARRAAADRRRPRPPARRRPLARAQPVARVRGRRAAGPRVRAAPRERRLGPGPGPARRRPPGPRRGLGDGDAQAGHVRRARRAPAGDGAPRGDAGSGRGSGWSSARRRCGPPPSGSPGPTTRRRGCSAARPPRRCRSSRCSGPRSARRGAGRRPPSPGRCAASSRSWPATAGWCCCSRATARSRWSPASSAASAPTTASPAPGCRRRVARRAASSSWSRPARARCRAAPRTRANVALPPVPGGAGDPDIVRAERLFAPPGADRRRPVLGDGRGAGRGRRRGRRAQAARRAGELRRAPGRDPRRPRPGGAPPAPGPAARAARRRRRRRERQRRPAARAAAGAGGRPRRAAAGHRPRRPRRRRRPAARAGGRGPLVARASARTGRRPPPRSPTASSGRSTACCPPRARCRRPRSSTGSPACSSAPTSPTRPSSAPASTAIAASPARRTTSSRPTTSPAGASEHGELIAEIVDLGHRLGFSCWIGARQQRRKVGGIPLWERLDDRELAGPPYFGRIRGEDLEDVDVIWYVRGRAAFLWEVEWTAMLGDTRASPRADAARRAPRPVPRRAARARGAGAPQARALPAAAHRAPGRRLAPDQGQPPARLGRRTRRWRWPTWRACSASTRRSSGRATSWRCSAADPVAAHGPGRVG